MSAPRMRIELSEAELELLADAIDARRGAEYGEPARLLEALLKRLDAELERLRGPGG